ncbi:MAG TPA: hypothetical protein VMU14_03850, partial [Acidimicrobiales bacterium]|nr:hypothetical protein [Acidimicrobiales bacterium]
MRGTPGNVSDCAIAVYLSSIVGADPLVKTVLVGSERVFVKLEGRWLFVGVSLPKPLRRFVAEFDREAYPALVRPPAEGARSVATSAPS